MIKMELVAEPGKQEITATTVLDAQRDRIFKALTDAALIPQWWGPAYLTTSIDRLEVKKGGIWRFIQRDPEGNEYAFNGVFHEVTPPERLVYTFEWEGLPGHILLETITLTERDGKTTLSDQSVFQSVEDRDGMLSAGMESGAEQSMQRLEKLLGTKL